MKYLPYFILGLALAYCSACTATMPSYHREEAYVWWLNNKATWATLTRQKVTLQNDEILIEDLP